MANHQSAKKRIRSSERKRVHNRIFRSKTHSLDYKAREALASGDLEAARIAVAEAIKQLDKSAGKGLIHPNNAARHKSRLAKGLAALESQA